MSLKGGTPIFDSIALVEIKANLRAATFSGTAAFVNSASGSTHGWTTEQGNAWSKETLNLLKELASSMERDLVLRHFGTGGGTLAYEPGATRRDPGGLGEFLAEDDPPLPPDDSTPSV